MFENLRKIFIVCYRPVFVEGTINYIQSVCFDYDFDISIQRIIVEPFHTLDLS